MVSVVVVGGRGVCCGVCAVWCRVLPATLVFVLQQMIESTTVIMSLSAKSICVIFLQRTIASCSPCISDAHLSPRMQLCYGCHLVLVCLM